ncbi:hypothetical protein [Amycolatopsis alba]|uniref:Uncharacterized protein n=1 Tax=Amycolatopsis alba DSM 44262 TaxID=1125972 RepID=A0A229R828_AMYAL|nr:hypothetical protein [Amycolatopsis alba]OXM42798.1 hypothetical protein CFP75_41385 [Amycolatopsis alba DSM 44262]
MPNPLPYDLTNDDDAEHYIREALTPSHRGRWDALLADDHVTQTYRVLKIIEANANHGATLRRDKIKLAEKQHRAGLMTALEHATQYRDFIAWRERASLFNTVLHQHLAQAADRVRKLHRDNVVESLRHSLLALAVAVDDHRQAHTGEESLADTALWARLQLLPWPTSDNASYLLADAVAAERGRRGPARHIENGLIEFQGTHVTGETVDVADLILEITDHAQPTCDRAHLIELWHQRTPDLLDAPGAKIAAAKGNGRYTTQRLSKSLTYLESQGLITRTTVQTKSKITVINRAALLTLRRLWDTEHFPLDNVDE